MAVSRPKFLIVEPRSIAREALVRFLSARFPDTPILKVGDFVAGGQSAREELPCVVFTNVDDRNTNGCTMAANIKRDLPAITVVLRASPDTRVPVDLVRRCGGDHFYTTNRIASQPLFEFLAQALRRCQESDHRG